LALNRPVVPRRYSESRCVCSITGWGSLYPCIAGHAINNSIPLGAALDWTWQTPALIVGSTLAALTIARLNALRLERRHLAPEDGSRPHRRGRTDD